jgi:hypothetical protein
MQQKSKQTVTTVAMTNILLDVTLLCIVRMNVVAPFISFSFLLFLFLAWHDLSKK